METQTIQQIITKEQLDNTVAGKIESVFQPFLTQAKEWEVTAMSIVVTSEDQKEEMQQARSSRLFLQKIRTDADKQRKLLKESALRYNMLFKAHTT